MKAGFARANITPPAGIRMEGWSSRDRERGAETVHDELFVRVLYAEHGGEEAVIAAFDLLFFSRAAAEWLKCAVCRALDLRPRQVLINTSHTHSGPGVSTYAEAYGLPPDWRYLELIQARLLEAAAQAKAEARDVIVTAAAGRTDLPISRRLPGPDGVEFRPNPALPVFEHAPACLLREPSGRPVCLVFSASCHPSTRYGWDLSAEYPGAACARLDAELGAPVSLFLQGAAGDTKARVIGHGVGADGRPSWSGGTWDDVRAAGEGLASDVLRALEGATRFRPAIRSALFESAWPLQPLPTRDDFERELASDNPVRRDWAQRQLDFLKRGLPLATSAGVLVQGLQLAAGLRFVALEGEPVGALGQQIVDRYGAGVTFPLGFSNGLGLYLVTTAMLSEGGYEPESYYEYGYAAPLAPGTERVLDEILARLQAEGVARVS